MDLMKLLVSDTDFQSDIVKERHGLGIPKNGFPNEKSNPVGSGKKKNAYEAWMDELYKKSDEVMESNSYRQKLKQLHADLKEGKTVSMRAHKKACYELDLSIPINRFSHVPKFLAEKYHLPDNFIDPIRWYFTHSTVTAPSVNFSFGPYEGARPWKEYGFIPVKIYARLTHEESLELSKELEIMGKHMPRYQPLKDIDRKLKIEESFRKRGDDFDHATGQPFKTTAADVAQVMFGSKKKRGQVYDASRELENLRKKRFGKS